MVLITDFLEDVLLRMLWRADEVLSECALLVLLTRVSTAGSDSKASHAGDSETFLSKY